MRTSSWEVASWEAAGRQVGQRWCRRGCLAVHPTWEYRCDWLCCCSLPVIRCRWVRSRSGRRWCCVVWCSVVRCREICRRVALVSSASLRRELVLWRELILWRDARRHWAGWLHAWVGYRCRGRLVARLLINGRACLGGRACGLSRSVNAVGSFVSGNRSLRSSASAHSVEQLSRLL